MLPPRRAALRPHGDRPRSPTVAEEKGAVPSRHSLPPRRHHRRSHRVTLLPSTRRGVDRIRRGRTGPSGLLPVAAREFSRSRLTALAGKKIQGASHHVRQALCRLKAYPVRPPRCSPCFSARTGRRHRPRKLPPRREGRLGFGSPHNYLRVGRGHGINRAGSWTQRDGYKVATFRIS